MNKEKISLALQHAEFILYSLKVKDNVTHEEIEKAHNQVAETLKYLQGVEMK